MDEPPGLNWSPEGYGISNTHLPFGLSYRISLVPFNSIQKKNFVFGGSPAGHQGQATAPYRKFVWDAAVRLDGPISFNIVVDRRDCHARKDGSNVFAV